MSNFNEIGILIHNVLAKASKEEIFDKKNKNTYTRGDNGYEKSNEWINNKR